MQISRRGSEYGRSGDGDEACERDGGGDERMVGRVCMPLLETGF